MGLVSLQKKHHRAALCFLPYEDQVRQPGNQQAGPHQMPNLMETYTILDISASTTLRNFCCFQVIRPVVPLLQKRKDSFFSYPERLL